MASANDVLERVLRNARATNDRFLRALSDPNITVTEDLHIVTEDCGDGDSAISRITVRVVDSEDGCDVQLVVITEMHTVGGNVEIAEERGARAHGRDFVDALAQLDTGDPWSD